MNFNELAQPWQANKHKAPRLPLRANTSFLLMHHAKNWELHTFEKKARKKKGEEEAPGAEEYPLFIPKLTKLIEKPGVNNVQNTGGLVDSSYSQSQFTNRGFEILRHQDHDYLRIYPAQGGNHYTHKWVEMELIGSELLRTTDLEGMASWRRSLVADRHIEPPHPGILKVIIRKMNNNITRLQQKAHIPAVKMELEQAEKDLELADKALAILQAKGVKAYE